MTSANIEAALITFISHRFPQLGNQINAQTPLDESTAIDSLGLLEIVSFIDEEFNVEVVDDDFVPENFSSVQNLAKLVVQKLS